MSVRRILETPLSDITMADIEALIAEEAEEGPRLELKRALSSNDPKGDPWMQGSNKIGDRARDSLAKEVVALANAYGGVLVLGVDETDDHPKRARGPAPHRIPRAIECAERLQQSLDSIIDPPLPSVEVRAVLTPASDGHGVILIRTAASTRAPHGHGKPPLAFMRNGSRSEPMSMRDLHSVFFETRSRIERINGLLEQRRAALTAMRLKGYGALIDEDGQPLLQDHRALYFRATAIAAEHLQLRVFEATKSAAFLRPQVTDSAGFGSGAFGYSWTPRLNGAEVITRSNRHFSRWYIGDAGIADAYGAFSLFPHKGRDDVFPPAVFPPVVAQIIALGEQLRRYAQRPEVELVIECEFQVPENAFAVIGDGRAFDSPRLVPDGSTRIGPFSIGDTKDYDAIFREAERGIWHGLGLPVGSLVQFDLPAWLAGTEKQQ